MIKSTLEQIEKRIQGLDAVDSGKKRELAGLFAELRLEIDRLSQTHSEQAESIARFAGASAHEATRREGNPALRELSVEGLEASVQDFEVSHPRLVQVVNSLCNLLSGLGI